MADVMGGEWCHVYVGRGEVERAVGGVTGDGDGRGSWIAKGKCQDEEVVTMEGTRNEDDHPLCLPPNTHTQRNQALHVCKRTHGSRRRRRRPRRPGEVLRGKMTQTVTRVYTSILQLFITHTPRALALVSLCCLRPPLLSAISSCILPPSPPLQHRPLQQHGRRSRDIGTVPILHLCRYPLSVPQPVHRSWSFLGSTRHTHPLRCCLGSGQWHD